MAGNTRRADDRDASLAGSARYTGDGDASLAGSPRGGAEAGRKSATRQLGMAPANVPTMPQTCAEDGDEMGVGTPILP